jgi:hypothetical protein
MHNAEKLAKLPLALGSEGAFRIAAAEGSVLGDAMPEKVEFHALSLAVLVA